MSEELERICKESVASLAYKIGAPESVYHTRQDGTVQIKAQGITRLNDGRTIQAELYLTIFPAPDKSLPPPSKHLGAFFSNPRNYEPQD